MPPRNSFHCFRTAFLRGNAALTFAAAFISLTFAAPSTRAQDSGAPAKPEDTLRLGFSSTIFSGLNEADARASVKALAATIAREHGINANPDPVITNTITETAQAVRLGLVDAISVTMEEYSALRQDLGFDRFLVAVFSGDPTETYLLLVHKQGAIRKLDDLQDKKVMVQNGARMTLARPWLNVQLAGTNLPTLSHLAASVTEVTKGARAILPVFFRQSDACLVTRRAFDTVVELNPQIGRDLQILASSPQFIPALFAFRSDCPASLKEKSVNVFTVLHRTLYGQQTLLIFQSNQVEECSPAAFENALALLNEYAQRCPEEHKARMSALHAPPQS